MATTKNTRRRRYLTFMTAILAVSIISVASAAWLASGSGPGQANAGTAEALTITASAVSNVDDVLYPNNDGNIRFVVHNPNPYNVDIDDVTFGTITANSGCTTHGVTFRDILATESDDLGLIVGAEDSLNVELVDGAYMDNSSSSECQGATFTATATINGESTDVTAHDDSTWHIHTAPAGWWIP